MDREFLKGLGLEKEDVDKVMAEHGKAINKAKGESESKDTEIKDLQAQIAKRDDDIAELKKSTASAEIKDQLQDLQDKYEADTAELQGKLAEQKLNHAVAWELNKAGARNVAIASKALDVTKLELDEQGAVKGLGEQITALKESDSYLFDIEPETKASPEDEGTAKPKFSAGGNPKTEAEGDVLEKLGEKYS